MHPFVLTALALTAVGALLKVLIPILREDHKRAKYIELGKRRRTPEAAETEAEPDEGAGRDDGRKVLIVFVVVVAVFGLATLVRYWNVIRQNQDSLYFSAWLFISMVGGMFVQVVAHNYRDGKSLFGVTRDQLVFPILFSVIVFYPIWAIAASASPGFFPVHAAFLNGYFWESVVSTASPPKPR